MNERKKIIISGKGSKDRPKGKENKETQASPGPIPATGAGTGLTFFLKQLFPRSFSSFTDLFFLFFFQLSKLRCGP